MTIHYLYIFDRNGSFLFYKEWHRKKQSGMSRDEEAKLMYGMIYSLKSFILKVSPVDLKEGYFSYNTNKYKLHFYETPTKVKVILCTDLTAMGMQTLMHQIVSQVFLDYAVLNPLCPLDKPIESEAFSSRLDELVKQNPSFASRVS